MWAFWRNQTDPKSREFVIPDFKITSGEVTPEQVQRNFELYPWNNKTYRAVWRGETTGMHSCMAEPSRRPWYNFTRGILVMQGVMHPDLLDAKFVGTTGAHYNACKKAIHEFKPSILAPYMSMPDFQKYAAIVDVDGTGWSSRFPKLLAFNSPVVKQTGTAQDYTIVHMQPYVHYVPVAADLRNITEAVRWVLDHRAKESLRMVHAANTRAIEITSKRYVEEYWYMLLKMYRCMLTYHPTLRNKAYPLVF